MQSTDLMLKFVAEISQESTRVRFKR